MDAELKKDFAELVERIENGALGEPKAAAVVLHGQNGDNNRISLCTLGTGLEEKEKIAETLAMALGRHLQSMRQEGENGEAHYTRVMSTAAQIVLGTAAKEEEDDGALITTTLVMMISANIVAGGGCCARHLEENLALIRDQIAVGTRGLFAAKEFEEASGDGETRH